MRIEWSGEDGKTIAEIEVTIADWAKANQVWLEVVDHLQDSADEEEEYTKEDWEADRADRILAERKEMDPSEWSEGPFSPLHSTGP